MDHRHQKRLSRSRAPAGAAPGTFRIDPKAPRPTIELIAYGPDDITEKEVQGLDELQELISRWPVVWINVYGLGDRGMIDRFQKMFDLHPLAVADVVNVTQRAKVELYGEQLFIVTRMATVDQHALQTEQLSMFLGQGFVLTFQEHVGDCLKPVRERLRSEVGRLRQAGADYLAYSLLDAVIDAYFPLLEQYGEWLEELEGRVITRPDENSVHQIRGAKRDLLTLRRALWPQRDAVNMLLRDPLPVVTEDTRLYLRDCYDHIIQLMDIIEAHRDLASGLQDIYLSSVSNRMNEVMKVLTIVATIFIPLTFIAGVYGMNFDPGSSPWNMPELRWFFGYPLVLIAMAATAGTMLVYFRRKGWLGGGRHREGGPSGPSDTE